MRDNRYIVLLVGAVAIGIYTGAAILSFNWNIRMNSHLARSLNWGVVATLLVVILVIIGDEVVHAIHAVTVSRASKRQ